jgi:D-alanine-D-alanine ligase
MTPDPYPDSDLWLRERRILVLHRHDSGMDGEGDGDGSDGEAAARAEGVNAARDISRALVARGHFVEVQGIDPSDLGDLLAQLRADAPDLVFNLCETLTPDGQSAMVLPTLLELLGVPYTGSGPLAHGLAHRGDRTLQILEGAGLLTPRWAVLPPAPRASDLDLVRGLGYPVLVRRAGAGRSAAWLAADEEELVQRLGALREPTPAPLLVEEVVQGRELSVMMLGNEPVRILGVQEVSEGGSSAPAQRRVATRRAHDLSAAVEEAVSTVARRCFAALEVLDYGRCDLRLAPDGTPYVVEVSPSCSLADGASFSLAAQLAGISYDQLIEQIAIAALRRVPRPAPPPPPEPRGRTPSRPPDRF